MSSTDDSSAPGGGSSSAPEPPAASPVPEPPQPRPQATDEAPGAVGPATDSATGATSAAPEGAGLGTPFALAQKLVAQKLPRADVLAQLKTSGLDDETARVALNAVDGATPSELPDATLALGINPLAPGSFALSDIGLSGNPVTVALYWMAFGAVVLVLVAIFLGLPELGVGEPLSEASAFWARVGMGLGTAAFAWGVFRLAGTVRLRRRPPGA